MPLLHVSALHRSCSNLLMWISLAKHPDVCAWKCARLWSINDPPLIAFSNNVGFIACALTLQQLPIFYFFQQDETIVFSWDVVIVGWNKTNCSLGPTGCIFPEAVCRLNVHKLACLQYTKQKWKTSLEHTSLVYGLVIARACNLQYRFHQLSQ